jgi:hypothetical protein
MSEPVQRPGCRAIGARPARLAAWPASREPSSGIAISKATAVMLDTPGMLIRMDAAILARMGSLLELEARPARSEVLFELKELYVAREALVKDRTAARNRGKALTLSLLKRQNAQRLEQIDRQIATVEAAILQIVDADESLADRRVGACKAAAKGNTLLNVGGVRPDLLLTLLSGIPRSNVSSYPPAECAPYLKNAGYG